MLLTLYTAYSQFQDKDKNVDVNAIVDNYSLGEEYLDTSGKNGGLTWKNKKDRPWIVFSLLCIFIIEAIVLYSGLLMAIRVSKTPLQLFLHILFAVFLSVPYVFISTVLNTPAYESLLIPTNLI